MQPINRQREKTFNASIATGTSQHVAYNRRNSVAAVRHYHEQPVSIEHNESGKHIQSLSAPPSDFLGNMQIQGD